MEKFADLCAKILRDPHIKNNPRKYIRKKKKDDQLYNEPFTETELKSAIKQQKNTVIGEDTIHPQIRKKLS